MLTISQLVKRFRDREVLRGVSLGLDPGNVGVLIGPSGSGKSTILRCINGLESFNAGEITVAGGRLNGTQSYGDRQRQLLQIRRNVGMVFQQFNLFPHMTVLGNVIEAPLRVLKTPRDKAVAEARKLLDRVGLGDRLDSRPSQLSGGQQQRVAIARALAMHPELVLFDEPTSALDPKMTGEVLAVMADLARQGETMLVVTHAMEFARRVAHQVHVIADGVIVESGPPAQIFESPQHSETRELLQQERMK
ncbi:MAG TPA: amino acid ABC transporter ATP-binding protein [Planctomycetaceae bacterium]|nr:amino acid ABC transporter ATP-binding protein [Planctomycetaceae bacterium]